MNVENNIKPVVQLQTISKQNTKMLWQVTAPLRLASMAKRKKLSLLSMTY
jgi:hypothetical protein